MPSLTIVNGDHAGKHFVLAMRPLSIGRDPSRDIQLVDPKVSRKHAIIRPEDSRYVIRLTKSLNGLKLNDGEVQEEAALSDGDRILLGDTELLFTESDTPDLTNAVHHRKVADRKVRDVDTLP